MLDEARRYYGMGFSVLWLMPRSKRPISKGWTKGPREPWGELEKKYRKGFNLGVRLGSTSKIGNNYLAVIDCDVKSSDPKHQDGMREALNRIFPRLENHASIVFSGRGNGSRHLYVVTKEPISEMRLARGNATINKDSRIPTWEIVLMGENRQVVLPPSIHPDTGKEYIWDLAPWGKTFPLIETSHLKSLTRKIRTASIFLDLKPFKTVSVSIERLSQDTIQKIKEGKDVEDRSAALLSVTTDMVHHDYSDDEILTALTDRTNFLGQVAYEHAHTESRAVAAEWILKYTLKKVRDESRDFTPFMEEIDETPLSEKEAEIQFKELCPVPLDWRTLLVRTKDGKGPPISTVRNVVLILSNVCSEKLFLHNAFSGSEIYGGKPPWRGEKDQELTDSDLTEIKCYLSKHYRFEPSTDKLNEAVCKIARDNSFHPVRDYLATLEWDGVPRIDNWITTYLGADGPEEYLKAVSRKVLCAMIARVMHPGIKFDHVLILEGGQGIGKSTSIRNLAGSEWFSDAHINIADKDAVLALRSIWVLELGELSGMRKADVDHFKEFVTRTADRIRVPYGRRTESFPRQCIFIGSTNNTEFLKDDTGNRRFWPVRVGKCNFQKLKEDRDQLLAEAKFAWELKEPLYIEDPIAAAQAIEQQRSKMEHDMLEDEILEFIESQKVLPSVSGFDPNGFQMQPLFDSIKGVPSLKNVRADVWHQKRVGSCLRKLGYEKRDKRVHGNVLKFWYKKEVAL